MKVNGQAASPIMVNYDHKLAGESVSNPKQRVPPFREQHLMKCVRAWMECRPDAPDAGHLHDADEFILYDGGKPGLANLMLKAFDANAPKVPKHVTVMYLRDDVHTRRERAKCGCVNQLETQVRVTAKATTKPLKQGSHYGAWNDGNAIAGVRLCDNTSPMVMTGDRDSKKELFGPHRFPVGGAGRVDDDEYTVASPAAKRSRVMFTTDIEQVFYHPANLHFFMDEVQTGCYSAVVDFSPGQGYLAWAASLRSVPALLVCLTATHKLMLYLHMINLCLLNIATEGSELYDAKFVAILAAHGDREPRKSDPPKPPVRQMSTPKAAAASTDPPTVKADSPSDSQKSASTRADAGNASGGEGTAPKKDIITAAEAKLMKQITHASGEAVGDSSPLRACIIRGQQHCLVNIQ